MEVFEVTFSPLIFTQIGSLRISTSVGLIPVWRLRTLFSITNLNNVSRSALSRDSSLDDVVPYR